MRTVTADGLVRSALRTLGVYAAGEDPEDDEITDGIESCNEMIDAWATNNLTIPSEVREQFKEWVERTWREKDQLIEDTVQMYHRTHGH